MYYHAGLSESKDASMQNVNDSVGVELKSFEAKNTHQSLSRSKELTSFRIERNGYNRGDGVILVNIFIDNVDHVTQETP